MIRKRRRDASIGAMLEALEPRVMLSAVISDESARVPGVRGPVLATGDFNSDGIIDVIAHRFSDSTYHRRAVVWFGKENGKFRRGGLLPHTVALDRQYNPNFELVAGRFTSDEHPDLALVARSGSGARIRLFAGDGAGGFTLQPGVARVDGYSSGAAAAAMDGPNARESLVIIRTEGVTLLKLHDDGRPARQVTVENLGLRHWRTEDIDLDGREDVLCEAMVLRARGRLRVETIDLAHTGTAPASVIIGDLNADGKPDLLFGSGGEVRVRYNMSTAPGVVSFAAAELWSFVPLPMEVPEPYGFVGSRTRIAGVGDVNNDGAPDVLLEHVLYGDYRVPYRETTGRLILGGAAASPDDRAVIELSGFSSYESIPGFGLMDLGGDGLLDIVHSEGELRTWRSLGEARLQRPIIGSVDASIGGNTGILTTIAAHGVTDPDGRVVRVLVYIDNDFSGTVSVNDFNYSYDVQMTSADTGTWSVAFLDYEPPGPRRALVIAVDDLGYWSEIAAVDFVIV